MRGAAHGATATGGPTGDLLRASEPRAPTLARLARRSAPPPPLQWRMPALVVRIRATAKAEKPFCCLVEEESIQKKENPEDHHFGPQALRAVLR
jgi:hypothetical protein